ncbi:hypothetical protein Tiera_039 [Polaromonas phage Tiera]|nr:hypothetical protein Tiera_039 [Polaromonas phage Tiera]
MTTFKEKLAAKLAGIVSSAPAKQHDAPKPMPSKPAYVPKPIAEDRDMDNDEQTVVILLNECELTEWEISFCRSIKLRLKQYANPLTVKQGETLDKIADKYLEEDGLPPESDMPPINNEPRQYDPKATITQRHVRGFDDMDDDIPF